MRKRTADLPRVSFIVPVYNDAVRLETCLKSIRANWYPADRLEIVVVDNGSSDGSTAVARRCGAKIVAIAGIPVAELRNRATHIASGEVLAFIDADNEIVPGWTASAVDALAWPDVAAAGAPYECPADGTWVQRAYGYLRGRATGRRDVGWLGSGNLAVSRAAFEAVGGFDASLETCEDVDFCHRLRTAGFRVVSDERMKNVHHGDPATLWALFTGELWRGRDNLRVSFRRPFVWREIPSAIVPIIDVVLIAISLLLLLAPTSNARWLSGGALLTASVPAGLRVGRAMLYHGRIGGASIAQAFAVACVYDVARALAVVTRVSHRTRRSATT
jgi:glycosyltransferase involved in cell wall biosynthesis